jgi:hypothetical protein
MSPCFTKSSLSKTGVNSITTAFPLLIASGHVMHPPNAFQINPRKMGVGLIILRRWQPKEQNG